MKNCFFVRINDLEPVSVAIGRSLARASLLAICITTNVVKTSNIICHPNLIVQRRSRCEVKLMIPTQPDASYDLMIVDARPEDYFALLESLDPPLQSCFLSSGQAAMELLPRLATAEWLVNLQLPDMSGIELFTHLRRRRPGISISLVADAYSTQSELAARSAGASAFLCKPPEMCWIQQLGRRRSTSPAGLQTARRRHRTS